ncbi:EipB family protein [Martelella endophytica]|uniref:EipB family protein n=1 Tax=Martelella endophytica TaxID=1486262 RepID=UPI0005F14D7E|nr:DUF1849 family protein [Martelella endophytica]
MAGSAAAAGVSLAPHQAIYDLSLGWASGNSGIEALDGRFVYSFTGGDCSGYSTDMRMVTDITREDGSLMTDQSSSSYEDLAEGSFAFSNTLYSDFALQSQTNGEALRKASDVIDVTLGGDQPTSVELKKAEFPTEYLAHVIRAADHGKRVYASISFDGSGEKAMRAVTLIGDAGVIRNPAEGEKAARNWPITTAYYDLDAGAGDQTPSYTVSMVLSEDGVSRDLMMDFGDFKIAGTLTSLKMLKAAPCGDRASTASSAP